MTTTTDYAARDRARRHGAAVDGLGAVLDVLAAFLGQWAGAGLAPTASDRVAANVALSALDELSAKARELRHQLACEIEEDDRAAGSGGS